MDQGMRREDCSVDNVLAMTESQHGQESLEDPSEMPAIRRRMLRMNLFEGVEAIRPAEHVDSSGESARGRKRINQHRQIVSISGIDRCTCKPRQDLLLDVQMGIAFRKASYLEEIKLLRGGARLAFACGEMDVRRIARGKRTYRCVAMPYILDANDQLFVLALTRAIAFVKPSQQ